MALNIGIGHGLHPHADTISVSAVGCHPLSTSVSAVGCQRWVSPISCLVYLFICCGNEMLARETQEAANWPKKN